MMTIAEDQAASLIAIKSMAQWLRIDRAQLARVFADRANIDRSIAEHDGTSSAGWCELYLNTAHEAAKLLLAARDLVIIQGQAYWREALMDFQCFDDKHSRPNIQDFIAETMPASCEFQPGAPETEALCAALIANGSKAIDA